MDVFLQVIWPRLGQNLCYSVTFPHVLGFHGPVSLLSQDRAKKQTLAERTNCGPRQHNDVLSARDGAI